MDGSRNVTARSTAKWAAAAVGAGASAIPRDAFAAQDDSGDTSVFVTMEYADAARPSATRAGNVEQVVDVAPSPQAAPASGLLPQTGDMMTVLTAVIVLAALSALLAQLFWSLGAKRRSDGDQ